MSKPALDVELAQLQTALARLTPTPDSINLAQLLFRAGQESVPRRGWAWPCATAAALLLAAGLGGMLLFRPGPQGVPHVVFVRVEVPATSAEQSGGMQPWASAVPSEPKARDRPPDETDYLTLRRQVLAHGVDALAPLAPWPDAAPSRNLDALLDLPPEVSREPSFLRMKNLLKSGDAS
jgi:hypothetical protein